MKSNRQLKQIAVEALKSEFGFAPKQNDIVLLEADGDGTFILFRVGTKQYRFESYILRVGGMATVWCGSGTIERYPDIQL